MSLEANKGLIRRWYYEMWNPWNFELADALLAPDLNFSGSLGTVVRGVPAFKDYMRSVQAAFPDFHNHIEDLIAESDKVVARLSYTGTHRGTLYGIAATGCRVTYAGVAIFTIRAGRVVEGWVLGDVFGLHRQLSGVEGP